MTPTTTEQPVLNEERWNEWIEKGKRHNLATARKFRIALAIVLPVAGLACALWFYWLK